MDSYIRISLVLLRYVRTSKEVRTYVKENKKNYAEVVLLQHPTIKTMIVAFILHRWNELFYNSNKKKSNKVTKIGEQKGFTLGSFVYPTIRKIHREAITFNIYTIEIKKIKTTSTFTKLYKTAFPRYKTASLQPA